MDWHFYDNIKKLEEILLKYNNYSDLEKLDLIWDINNCFKEILNQRYVKYYDIELIQKIHTIILKLDCLDALVRLDMIMLEQKNNSDYRGILSDDIVNNIVDIAKRRLKLFITDGFNYQLTIKDGCLAKPFEYNNQVLNKYGRSIVKDTLRIVELMEFCLDRMNMKVNIVGKLYQVFTTEQLAFIYAQLDYFEYVNNLRFEHGSFDNSIQETIERIFDTMRKRNSNEKIKFMRIICELGYCNMAMGICAMLVELYKTMDDTLICCMLREVLSSRKYGIINYDIERDVDEYLDSSREIKKLRDDDIMNGNEPDTIYNYSMKYAYSGRKNLF